MAENKSTEPAPANQPWHKMPHAIIERLMLVSGNAVKVYLWLARRADKTSGECYPSLGEIGRRAGFSRGTASRMIAELEAAKLISVERRHSEHGDSDVSLYRLLGVAPAQHVLRPQNTGVAPAQQGCCADGPGGVAPAQRELDTENKRQGNKKGAAAAAFSAADVTVPASLDTAAVRKSLGEWLEYKRARGQAYKSPAHLQKMLVGFEQHGAAAFIAAVNLSIGNNWAGIFPPDRKGSSNGRSTARTYTDFDPNAKLTGFANAD